MGSATMPPEVISVLMGGSPLVPSLVDNDPPAHTRFRGLVSRAFTGRRLTESEPFIRSLIDELIHSFPLCLPQFPQGDEVCRTELTPSRQGPGP